MNRRIAMLALTMLAGQVVPGQAKETAEPGPQQVVVTASQSDTEARRDFVAGKIVIGRKRIEESGLRTVQELLKREPAVTISGDGRIGLLNMPGYTQILVDGQAPNGALDATTLDLVHVEKIEIVKSSVAEFGPYGIAGTINIVTRAVARKTSTETGLVLNTRGAYASLNTSLSHNESSSGSPLRWSVNLSASRSATPNTSRVRQVLVLPDGSEQFQSNATISGSSRSDSIIMGSNFTWQRAADDTVSLSPEVYSSRGPTLRHESRRWADGTALDSQQEARDTLNMASLPVRWIFKPTPKSRIELSARTHVSHYDTAQERDDIITARAPIARQILQQRDGNTNSVELAYKVRLDGSHDVKMGGNLRRTMETAIYDYRLAGMPDPALAALGNSRTAKQWKRGAYLQDEWRVSESVAINGGISGSANNFDVDEGSYRATTKFGLWSPSFHVSKKLGDDDKRQLRLSLARNFRAPEINTVTLRPIIHPLAPCPLDGQCGPNSVETADIAGNPGLRPERALGLNLSYEHGFGADSQVTIELFTRNITDKFGTDIALENVTWASGPRYVARPANLGTASSSGIDVEFDLSLRDLSATAPKATVRGSVGLAQSRVSSLPAPDNRLDKQTPWTAKLGASYSLPNHPWKLDVDASWSPSVWVRSSLSERISIARRFDLDASAIWTLSMASRVVFGIKASFPGTTQGINEYFANGDQTRINSTAKNYTGFSLSFDTKL